MTDDVKADSATTEGPKPEAIPDNDPMLVEMREAEEEIAGKVKEPEAVASAETEPKPGEPAKPSPMIPKARFDEVLADRDVLKGQAGYWQGVAATQAEMLKAGKPAEGVKEGQPAAVTETDPIAKAEAEKLAAAKRYEDGEISLVDFKTLEIAADRTIRAETDKKTKVDVEGVKRVTQEVVQDRLLTHKQQVALSIQDQHPYVKELDSLPADQAKEAWAMIENEAVRLLKSQGVNAYANTADTNAALIRMKAELTDKYGPALTGKTIAGQKAGQSDTANERAAKLDLSTQQPPTISGNVQATKTDLTDRDIENMSQDQIADLMLKAPQVAERAAGFKNR